MKSYSSKTFDYTQDFTTIDFRKNPELYQIGRGEQGVLMVEPYKSEILPHWRFKTANVAKQSAEKIYHLFVEYKKQKDFVGMDMTRKFLQMGYTRSRRYANHKSGRKYAKDLEFSTAKNKKVVLPQEQDWNNSEKAQAAAIFYQVYSIVKNDSEYIKMKQLHQAK